MAVRAALIFGNIQPGDAAGLMKYTMERVPAFVNAFAPLDDVIVACGAGAIALGFPVITNEQENIFRVPKSLIVQLFYIVIDYDAVQNEETESYEVHFLNMVDEADLMALLEEMDIDIPDKTPEPTPTPKPTVEVITEPEESDGMSGGILLIVFALLVGGVVLYYFKVIKNKPKQKVPSYTDEYDMDDDDIWEKEV